MAYDKAKIVPELCKRLSEGNSLVAVCDSDDMPGASTVQDWMAKDEDISGQIMRAREVGYMRRADRAVMEAKTAPDAALGRLALDAERWYLGKLSNAFSDDKKKDIRLEHSLSPEAATWLGIRS